MSQLNKHAVNSSYNCDYFYKVNTEEGFKYYGMKILTNEISYVDEILDQINKCEGVFIEEKEFFENIKTPMELDVKDSETETITVATLLFEAIDLDEVTDEHLVLV